MYECHDYNTTNWTTQKIFLIEIVNTDYI